MKILQNVTLFGRLTLFLLIISLLPLPWPARLIATLFTGVAVVLTLISGLASIVVSARSKKSPRLRYTDILWLLLAVILTVVFILGMLFLDASYKLA